TGEITMEVLGGDLFAVFSLTLWTTVSGDQPPPTFTGTTAGGSTVTATPPFVLNRDSGFQTYALPDTFGALTKLAWTGDGVLVVDNVAAPLEVAGQSRTDIPSVTALTGAPAPDDMTPVGSITVNADSGTVNGAGSGQAGNPVFPVNFAAHSITEFH